MIPKPKRQKDPEYIKYIKGHCCLLCMAEGVDAHHIITRGAGGSDYTTVPLCRACHSKVHRLGLMRILVQEGVDLWEECCMLLVGWLNVRQAV